MLEEEIIKILESVGVKTNKEALEIPPDEEFGDIAFPCFQLAKEQRRNPLDIAKELTSKIHISRNPLIIKIEARGPYVNFFFYWEKVAEKILDKILSKKKSKSRNKKRIMIEYSQPNPVHPMHVGHSRGTFIGDTLCNVFEHLGYDVIRANYMNDIGLQVAKLVTAYKLWTTNKRPKGKPDRWLWQYYIKFHEEALKDPSLEGKARQMLREYELENNPKTKKLWDKIVGWCVQGFKETYKDLGIKFDVYFYENDFRKSGKLMVEEAIKRNLAFKSAEDTIVADLEKYGIPNTVLLRSDGTGLYITSDLGLTLHKFKKYGLDQSVWVVSSQQNLNFKQLFKVLDMLGYEFAKNCRHVSFEHVNLPEGKMSSREGRAIMLDEVIQTLTRQAMGEVEKRNPKMSSTKKLSIAKKVAISAIKYAVLKIEPEDSIIFDWSKMLSFDGNTGPYLLYAHTRCSSILKKAKKFKAEYFSKLSTPERHLIKLLMNYENTLMGVAKQYRPNMLCNYVYSLATAFSNFYQNCPVLKAETTQQKNFRLTLTSATKIVLEDALKLLGIKTPEIM